MKEIKSFREYIAEQELLKELYDGEFKKAEQPVDDEENDYDDNDNTKKKIS